MGNDVSRKGKPTDALWNVSAALFDWGRMSVFHSKELPFVQWVRKEGVHTALGIGLILALILGVAGLSDGHTTHVARIIAGIIMVPILIAVAILFFPAAMAFTLGGAVWAVRAVWIGMGWITGLIARKQAHSSEQDKLP